MPPFASQNVRFTAAGETRKREIKKQEVFIRGKLPLMTERGTFIIQRAERVIVKPDRGAAGVYFKDEQDKNGRKTFNASSDPQPGSLAEVRNRQERSSARARRPRPARSNCHVLIAGDRLSDNDVLDKTQAFPSTTQVDPRRQREGISPKTRPA